MFKVTANANETTLMVYADDTGQIIMWCGTKNM